MFYKYLKNEHPEIVCKYVISKKSFDLERVDPNDIVWHGSWKNYVYFITAGKLISTHAYGYSPDFQFFSAIDRYNIFKVYGKRIYLTHYLLYGFVFNRNRKVTKLDLYVCSSKIDYDYILEASDYGKEVVKLIGSPRMDNLYNNRDIETDNTILIMPTWRLPFTKMSKEEFKKSQYYNNFQMLLSNDKFIEYIKRNKLNVIFYPHIEVQKFIDCFHSPCDRIIVGDATKYVVEDLLLKCKMMITDYSTVNFDFALLRKCVVYFQFDQEKEFQDRPWGTHFLFERDAFGPIFTELSELIDYVTNMKDLSFDDIYEERIKKAFPIFDNKNCERNFNAIESL